MGAHPALGDRAGVVGPLDLEHVLVLLLVDIVVAVGPQPQADDATYVSDEWLQSNFGSGCSGQATSG